jgi:hypothetical protein
VQFRERLAYFLPPFAAFVVAAAAFTLSFVALSEVSVEVAAVPAHLSWLVPIVVDGGILAGSASLWAASYRQRKRDVSAYATVIILLGFSVVVNASHAGDTILAKAIASLPPLVLLATLELVASGHRAQLPRATARSGVNAVSARAATAPRAPSLAPDTGALPPRTKAKTSVTSAGGNAGASKTQLVRDVFAVLVSEGKDPLDPALATIIAERVGVTSAYVRRIIRPLRELG